MSDIGQARRAVADTGRRMTADGLVTGTAGNVSVRVGDLVAVSPSGMDYAAIGPDDVCVVDLDGTPVDGPHRPSSETPLHLAVYHTTGARAVVHHHGLHSTAVSLVQQTLPAVHYYIIRLGGPPRVAPYATYGTPELAASVETALRDRTAALMQNHGAVAYGTTLDEAYDRAQLVEWLAQLYTTAAPLGTLRILTDDELAAVVARREQS
ncbi:class II aldolase/adducin family protein [soil metagenome]